MIGQEIIYGPCPCGSGKKFKFCCYKEFRSRLSDDMTPAEVAEMVRCTKAGRDYKDSQHSRESHELYDDGLELVRSGKFAEAREKFRRVRELEPRFVAAWNNESGCAWELGDYRAACDIQREGNSNCAVDDSFGLARMSVCAYALGLEYEASEALAAALKVPPLSAASADEVCVALALKHRHRDIVEYVAGAGMQDSDGQLFYAGVAHANLGDLESARKLLMRIGEGTYGTMAEDYLWLMDEGERPQTTAEDVPWPYFTRYNFAPADRFKRDMEAGVDPLAGCPRALAEDCIEILLSTCELSAENALELVRKLDGERARRMAEALERMVEDARRAADVVTADAHELDSHGRPRISLEEARSADEAENGEMSEDDNEMAADMIKLISSGQEISEELLLQAESAMRLVAEQYPDSPFANIAYYNVLRRRDRELADGLLRTFHLEHPDSLSCACVMISMGFVNAEYDMIAEIVDHFEVPWYKIEPEDYREWGLAVMMLSINTAFKEAQPAAYARVQEFLKAFEIVGKR